MADGLERFNRSFTEEVKATIMRIDDLIGAAHYASVGGYKEGVIRKQLLRCLPSRYSVGTGFVVSQSDGSMDRSKQIDVLVWDSHNYAPVFADGSFVVIPPQALRVAIEVKGNLIDTQLRKGLENLDSLTQFIQIIDERHSADPHARGGFRRFIVAAQSKHRFPHWCLNQIYNYYCDCNNSWTIDQRVRLVNSPGRDLTPFISGVAILGKGMIRAVRMDEQFGYLVSSDVAKDGEDCTIGLIRQALEAFLTNDLLRRGRSDSVGSMPENTAVFLPIPFIPHQGADRTASNVFIPDKASNGQQKANGPK